MKPPEAFVEHKGASRIRLRIPSRKRDRAFFERVRKTLAADPTAPGPDVNDKTGSVLFVGKDLDLDVIRVAAEKGGLFTVKEPASDPATLPRKAVQPIGVASEAVERLTGGSLDLPGALFFSLLGVGAYQILRGNFAAPPWYTAFWYAFGVFTKQLVDHGENGDGDDGDGD